MIVDTPNWSVPNHIKAITTSRLGGVSLEPYASLNLGEHTQDDAEHVKQNRARISAALNLPNEPIWLKQIHSTLLLDLDAVDISSVDILTGDGSITTKSGCVCAVLTADCMPLFLTNRAGNQVAVVHAGWRGMADGIIEVGVLAFNDKPEEIIAWAGPCIGAEHFEVGPEVRTALDGSDKAYKESSNQGKYLADLYQLAGERLAALGVSNYGHSSACTYDDKERFFSYRRDGECGRMASLIWIDAA